MFDILLHSRTIDEILGMLAPLIEIIAFICLDKAQRLDKKPLLPENSTISEGIVSICRKFNPKEERKIRALYKTGYSLMYIGCIFWFLSSLIPYLQETKIVK